MDLILWRHAQAHPLREGQTDMERALTSKGERQAQRMGDWLNQRLAASTRVLVSPAVRAQQTARALGRPFRTIDAVAPDQGVIELLNAASWPDAGEPMLMVGHQPTMGRVAAQLLTGSDQPWAVKKAAVWWLRARLRDGFLQVTLQAVQSAELL